MTTQGDFDDYDSQVWWLRSAHHPEVTTEWRTSLRWLGCVDGDYKIVTRGITSFEHPCTICFTI